MEGFGLWWGHWAENLVVMVVVVVAACGNRSSQAAAVVVTTIEEFGEVHLHRKEES